MRWLDCLSAGQAAGLGLFAALAVVLSAQPGALASSVPPAGWAQQAPAASPPALADAAMAYDPATGTVVMFGGYAHGYLSSTWTWNGSTWTRQAPAAHPPG